MKTVFRKPTRDDLIVRINALDENQTAQWGKMNVYQMLEHCSLFEEMVLTKTEYKRTFLGRIFGKMVLRGFLKDEAPMKQNMPTLTQLRVNENGDVEFARKRWISLLEEYANFSNHGFVHPFLGKMTKEQAGYLAYKHADHHLRQFSA